MYVINFDQVSSSEAWREDIAVIAADDLTPLDSALDGLTLTLQVSANRARGYGDQSQRFGSWPAQVGNTIGSSPSISAATGDGTGQLSLVGGVLNINIQQATMAQLLPGYYDLGCTIKSADTVRQLFVGVLPLYDGGVA